MYKFLYYIYSDSYYYKIRKYCHALLSTSHNKVWWVEGKPTKGSEISLESFASTHNIDRKDILLAATLLEKNGDAKYLTGDIDNRILITPNGIISFLERKYPKEYEQAMHDRLYLLTRWLLPLVALFISVLSLYFSTCNKYH